MFHSHGISTARAGILLSLSLVVGLIPALTVPTFAARARDQRNFVIAFVSCIAAGWLGVIFAPTAAPCLWVGLLGFGQNAMFPLALTLIVLRGGTVISTAALSTLVQTVGYLFAAVGPLAIGAIHDITAVLDAGAGRAAGAARAAIGARTGRRAQPDRGTIPASV